MNVLKWCLNRPHQAKHFNELSNFAGLNPSSECYKPLREIEIQKSENIVSTVISVLENEYLNPFSIQLDQDKLYNLSSGSYKKKMLTNYLIYTKAGNYWQKNLQMREYSQI